MGPSRTAEIAPVAAELISVTIAAVEQEATVTVGAAAEATGAGARARGVPLTAESR